MDIAGKNVAVLVHNYFEQAEFEEPIKALKQAGAEVTVISTDKLKLQAFKHVDKGDKFDADILIGQASIEDYDALVLPGGVINADRLRTNLDAQEWLLEFLDGGKPVAVICHAPWLLVSADAIDGRRLTSWFSLRDDIINAGGEWLDLPVVVDDNLITSRKPDDLPYFNDQLISQLAKQPTLGRETKTSLRTRLRSGGYKRKLDGLTPEGEEEIITDEDLKEIDAVRRSSLGLDGSEDLD